MTATPDPEEPREPASEQEDDRALARRLSEEALAGTDQQAVRPINSLDALRRRDYEQDITLKKSVATFARRAVGAQLLAADAVVGVYIGLNHGRVPGAVIESWIGATVVQVIGILLVIARYLFPRREDTGPPSNPDPSADR